MRACLVVCRPVIYRRPAVVHDISSKFMSLAGVVTRSVVVLAGVSQS